MEEATVIMRPAEVERMAATAPAAPMAMSQGPPTIWLISRTAMFWPARPRGPLGDPRDEFGVDGREEQEAEEDGAQVEDAEGADAKRDALLGGAGAGDGEEHDEDVGRPAVPKTSAMTVLIMASVLLVFTPMLMTLGEADMRARVASMACSAGMPLMASTTPGFLAARSGGTAWCAAARMPVKEPWPTVK
jgi:hypothetical protein